VNIRWKCGTLQLQLTWKIKRRVFPIYFISYLGDLKIPFKNYWATGLAYTQILGGTVPREGPKAFLLAAYSGAAD